MLDYVIIIGPDGHGKSTVAAALSAVTGWPIAETGDVCLYYLARIYRGSGIAPASCADVLRADKSMYRGMLEALGDIICDIDPAALARAALKPFAGAIGTKIIVGLRRTCELEALLKSNGGERLAVLEVLDWRKAPGSYTEKEISFQRLFERWLALDPTDGQAVRLATMELARTKTSHLGI